MNINQFGYRQKTYLKFLTIAILIILPGLFFFYPSFQKTKGFYPVENREPTLSPKINYHLFKVEKGWGYEISIKNRKFIRQETIPAIAGDKGFSSSDEAEKVAKLVMQRLTNKQNPAIRKSDLIELNIDHN